MKMLRSFIMFLRALVSIFSLAPAAEQAGYLNQVFVLAGSTAMVAGTGAKLLGCDNASYERLCALLEITQFGDTYVNKMGGLKDSSVSVSGNLYTGDTTGQDVLIPGNTVFIGLFPSGPSVASVQIKALVENFNTSFDVTGKQTFTCSLKGIAAPVTLPARA